MKADTITVESLMEKLRHTGPGLSYSSRRLLYEIAIIESPHLTTTRTLELSRWDRFRIWIENLADEADVYYHFPRVQRAITEPVRKVFRIGNRFYCHPSIAAELRKWRDGE